MGQRTQQPSQDASQTLADASVTHDLTFSSVKVAGVARSIPSGAGDGATGTEVAANRLVPMELDVATDPKTAKFGVDCGMPEMCGLDPCLCGVPDAYGQCACNGTEDVAPTVSYQSSDAGVATVEEAFGRTWIVPHGTGDTKVTVTARLAHHQDATYPIPVHVGGPTVTDAGAVAGAALLAAVVALLVRFTVRRLRIRRQARRAADE